MAKASNKNNQALDRKGSGVRDGTHRYTIEASILRVQIKEKSGVQNKRQKWYLKRVCS